VEDSLIVALRIERMLRKLGAAQALLCSTNQQAIAHIEKDQIDAAILDINLKGEMSYAAAEALEEKQIPFVFETGYGQTPGLPERFAGRKVVAKPFSEVDLAEALLGVARQSGR
jgi:CheY-like chemotaxis protein